MSNKEENRPYFIVGASGFAAELCSWVTSSKGQMPDGFIIGDYSNEESPLDGIKCYRESDVLGVSGDAYIAIANPEVRQRVQRKLKVETCLEFPNFIHDSAIVDAYVFQGNGNLVLPFAIVCPRASIGSFNILNIYSSVAHDAKLREFNTLSPYATLNGNANCVDFCFLGTHATLGPGVSMQSRALLAANSFARKDLPENSLSSGVPAKLIRVIKPDE